MDDLGERLGGKVVNLERLSGGASRETWSFDLERADGTVEELVVQRSRGASMAVEAALLRTVAAAGVPVPEVVDADATSIVSRRVDGETIARRILRDDAYATVRPSLAAQCGQILASLHALPADAVPGLEHTDELSRWRSVLDATGQAHPAFELAFRWLERDRPSPAAARPATIVHGDFRNGNVVVDAERGIVAVLDWELAHVGDPLEDLGWLCVKSWRFGADLPVGGFGTYDQLVGAYETAGGHRVDRAALRWWEVVGTLKWGIMCIMQAMAHTTGVVRSVELAAIGRRVCEVEWDLLELIDA